jgi:hypothetical protein
MGDLLAQYEQEKKTWHTAAIYGHSKSSKLFPMTRADQATLEDLHIHTVSQLFAINNLTGTIDKEDNEVLYTQIGSPLLVFKLKELAKTLRNMPNRGKEQEVHTQATHLFQQDKNMSSFNKKALRKELDEKINIAPAYQTRIRDEVYVPDGSTFKDAYKVLQLGMLSSKTKETIFQVLNRTIWTNNKAFKSHMRDSPDCERCGLEETMEHLLYECEHYSSLVWAELGQLLTAVFTVLRGEHVSRIELTPKEIVYNKPHPSVLLFLQDSSDQKLTILIMQEVKRDIVFRRMNMPQRPEEVTPLVRVQAHIHSVLTKLKSLLAYQGKQPNSAPLQLLETIISTLNDRVD